MMFYSICLCVIVILPTAITLINNSSVENKKSPAARFDVTPAGCDIRIAEERKNVTIHHGVKSTIKLYKGVFIFIGVGTAAAIIATIFHMLRKYVYHDADSLDTVFDAGGQVSTGLTATTIVSQWTWSATILQSATVASKYGISGPYWYATAATIQVILFSILSVQLKIRAPGAKTFLQVIKARFGKKTHIVYCIFAGFTNIMVTATLVISGCAVLSSLVKNLTEELAILFLVTIIGGYTLIGGLGATIYVSYFNTAIIFVLLLVLIIEIFHNPLQRGSNVFKHWDTIYEYLSCTQAPQGNSGRSYLTFVSEGGLHFGIINIIGNFGIVFCDQSFWQSSIAAKPSQGVWGFILGGLVWFAIPFTMATTMGLAYLALSSRQGEPLLSAIDVEKGLVAPAVVQSILGSIGEYAMIFLILMAVMSTGSAEVIAVASVLVYDIYQIYVQPFRRNKKDGQCVLCGKPNKRTKKMIIEVCSCQSMRFCKWCQLDTIARNETTHLVKPHYECLVHGKYREYMDHLLHYKNWCIVWTTILVIPLFLLCHAASLHLSWTFLFVGVLISPTVIPLTLALLWDKTNSAGMIVGATAGCFSGICAWLIMASTYPGGLSNFLINTGRDISMLVGNVVSISVGGLVCIIISFKTNKSSKEELKKEWERTRDIDNPLNPWVQLYRKELNITTDEYVRPPLETVVRVFRTPKIIAYSVGIILTIILVFAWPGAMVAVDILDFHGFFVWTTISKVWSILAAAFIIIVPLVQEIKAVSDQIKLNRKENEMKQNEINIDEVTNGRRRPNINLARRKITV